MKRSSVARTRAAVVGFVGDAARKHLWPSACDLDAFGSRLRNGELGLCRGRRGQLGSLRFGRLKRHRGSSVRGAPVLFSHSFIPRDELLERDLHVAVFVDSSHNILDLRQKADDSLGV